MIQMRVCMNDSFHGQIVFLNDRHDFLGITARIDDQAGFGDRVTHNCTVTL